MNKQLTDLINILNKDELCLLVQAYDHHIISCEREAKRPLSLLDYEVSSDFKELFEKGTIYDALEYESDLEDATLEEIRILILEFYKRVELALENPSMTRFEKLDLLIDELDVGNLMTEEEKQRASQFYEELLLYGYLPNEQGELIFVEPERYNDLSSCENFVWDDYQKVRDLLQKHHDELYVATLIDGGGRYIIAVDGWHFVNRIGYYLTSKRLVEEGGEVVL